jgi:hypothetical protein
MPWGNEDDIAMTVRRLMKPIRAKHKKQIERLKDKITRLETEIMRLDVEKEHLEYELRYGSTVNERKSLDTRAEIR